ncbi:MAG: hypothetical protein ABF299_07020 [Desulfobacterales bacterium]
MKKGEKYEYKETNHSAPGRVNKRIFYCAACDLQIMKCERIGWNRQGTPEKYLSEAQRRQAPRGD